MNQKTSVSKQEIGGLEVTTFKLNNGYSFKQFIIANEDVDKWLRSKPGFQFRKMCLRDDGYVVDVVGWHSAKEGKAIGGNIMRELSDSLVHEMIDQRTVSWNVMPVGHSLN